MEKGGSRREIQNNKDCNPAPAEDPCALPYSLQILLYERSRYFPAALAIAFSAVLVNLQSGLLLGFLSVTSRPVDRVSADVWVASPDVLALGHSHPIDEALFDRV